MKLTEYLKVHSESTKLVEGTKNSFNVTLGLGRVRDPEMHSESTHWVDKNSLVYASFLGNWIPLVRSYFKLISWSYQATPQVGPQACACTNHG